MADAGARGVARRGGRHQVYGLDRGVSTGAVREVRWVVSAMSDDRILSRGELERLFEPIERRLYLDLYKALPDAVARDCGISWTEDDGALRLTCESVDHPFLNRVMGVPGRNGEIEAWVESVTEHYRSAGVSRWMVQVAPTDLLPDVADAFTAAGVVPLRGWAKHAGRVERIEPPAAAADCDLRVESIGREWAEAWASVVMPAFGFPEGSGTWVGATVGRPGWRHYIAIDGDEPAAAAALFVAGGIGSLSFAATRPEYRRRGAQSALIARRIRDARRLGLEWLVAETDDELPDKPNPSYHNVERAGLPARYVRTNWGPPPPPPAFSRS